MDPVVLDGILNNVKNQIDMDLMIYLHLYTQRFNLRGETLTFILKFTLKKTFLEKNREGNDGKAFQALREDYLAIKSQLTDDAKKELFNYYFDHVNDYISEKSNLVINSASLQARE